MRMLDLGSPEKAETSNLTSEQNIALQGVAEAALARKTIAKSESMTDAFNTDDEERMKAVRKE